MRVIRESEKERERERKRESVCVSVCLFNLFGLNLKTYETGFDEIWLMFRKLGPIHCFKI